MKLNDKEFVDLISPEISDYKEKLETTSDPAKRAELHAKFLSREHALFHFKYLILESTIAAIKEELDDLKNEVSWLP